jgi:hypothetical protein
MLTKKGIWIVVYLLIVVTACAEQGAGGEPTPTPTAVNSSSAAVIPTATPSPTPTPRPSPTPTPTPIVPAIVVADQTLDENGRLTIASVTSPDAGWLVIYAANAGGAPATALGYTAVAPGENRNLALTVEPTAATTTLIAMLHQDAGEAGVFEFPGPDAPLPDEAGAVRVPFRVDIQLPLPTIEVEDQELGADGIVRIASVFTPERGWLRIHTDNAGEIGAALGQAALEPGRTDELLITIPWRQATRRLFAVVYADRGEIGRFDPEADLAIQAGGAPVTANFRVDLPLDIFAYDQPIVNGKIVIERAVSRGPGWLAVYYNDEGQPGLIIGFAQLQDGVNERVVVQLVETAATPLLYILLHENNEPLERFDFPAGDLPVRENGRVPDPYVLDTAPGNYLITRDQPLSDEDQLLVPLIVTDLAAWVVIYADDEDAPGAIIGQAWLPAGVNYDAPVRINAAQATTTLYARLHLDGGALQTFEYPDGPDIPMRRNRNLIQAPFRLLTDE